MSRQRPGLIFAETQYSYTVTKSTVRTHGWYKDRILYDYVERVPEQYIVQELFLTYLPTHSLTYLHFFSHDVTEHTPQCGRVT